MSIAADIQTLLPGDYVELYQLDAEDIGGGTHYFHNYPNTGSIWWQGREYSPWPVHGDGYALVGQGQQATPTFSVGDVDGSISALCVLCQDLVGAVLTRRRTLSRYLDARNFPDGVNPSANPDEAMLTGVWRVEQKINEVPGEQVDFELASLMDFGDAKIPARQIIANVCTWQYRGAECGYTGTRYFDKRGNPVADPSLDACGKCMSDCKLRFGEFEPLSFSGFPAAGLVRS